MYQKDSGKISGITNNRVYTLLLPVLCIYLYMYMYTITGRDTHSSSFIMLCIIIINRLEGQKVNLREQHDAFEFFNTLVDCVDEGLKVYGSQPIISRILGGSFADQKICKGCPHR